MKNLTKFVSSVLAIGILTTGGITAFAATDTNANLSTNSLNTNISEKASTIGSMKRNTCDFSNMEKSELTDEKKAIRTENMKERLAEQLKDGNITQEQYDEALANVEEGKRPRTSRQGKHGFGNMGNQEMNNEQKAVRTEHMRERLAEQLKDGNITQEQYDEALANVEEGKRPRTSRQGKSGFGNKRNQKMNYKQK